MFLHCLAFPRKDGTRRQYLQIVESYREGGRVRQKIIANLGRLDELIASGTLEKLSEALSRYVQKRNCSARLAKTMLDMVLKHLSVDFSTVGCTHPFPRPAKNSYARFARKDFLSPSRYRRRRNNLERAHHALHDY